MLKKVKKVNSVVEELRFVKKAKAMTTTETQSDQILNYLQSGKAITPIDALNMFGCFRLGARVYDLKQKGHIIKTEIIRKDGKNYASYSLETIV